MALINQTLLIVLCIQSAQHHNGEVPGLHNALVNLSLCVAM